VLGGRIGLGGAEFRLPLLIGFVALAAVIVNKAMSLIVVLTALPARLTAVPLHDVTARWSVTGWRSSVPPRSGGADRRRCGRFLVCAVPARAREVPRVRVTDGGVAAGGELVARRPLPQR
jgi:hypothetical protein